MCIMVSDRHDILTKVAILRTCYANSFILYGGKKNNRSDEKNVMEPETMALYSSGGGCDPFCGNSRMYQLQPAINATPDDTTPGHGDPDCDHPELCFQSRNYHSPPGDNSHMGEPGFSKPHHLQ